jgi:hypothetical protein
LPRQPYLHYYAYVTLVSYLLDSAAHIFIIIFRVGSLDGEELRVRLTAIMRTPSRDRVAAMSERRGARRVADASLSASLLSFPSHHSRHAMPATKQAPTRQAISLKGSTKLVTEFFKYAVNTFVMTIVSLKELRSCDKQDPLPALCIPRRRLPHG